MYEFAACSPTRAKVQYSMTSMGFRETWFAGKYCNGLYYCSCGKESYNLKMYYDKAVYV